MFESQKSRFYLNRKSNFNRFPLGAIMLIKLFEQLKKAKPLTIPYKGVVVSNTDPKQLGRVKCFVEGLFESADVERLPWVSKWLTKGGSGGETEGWVPQVGAEIIIEFKYPDDVYSPFYTGVWNSEIISPNAFGEDYPNTYGSSDEAGNQLSINRSKGTTEYKFSSGVSVSADQIGNLTVSGIKGKLRFESDDGQSFQEFDFASGVANTSMSEQGCLSGNKTLVESKTHDIKVGELNEAVTGSKNSNIAGTSKENVGGGKVLSVTTNYGETVGGNKSLMVAQETDETYGLGLKQTVATGGIIQDLLLGNKEVNLTLGNETHTLLAGNYEVAIIAGNLTLSTLLGSINLTNNLASIELTPVGGINLTTITGVSFTDAIQIELLAPLIKLGLGLAPIVTILTDPIEDYITGKPKIGVPTILAG